MPLLAVAAVLATLSCWPFPDAFGVALLLPPGRHAILWTPRANVVGVVGLLLVLAGAVLVRSGSRARGEYFPAAYVAAPLVLLPLSYLGFFCARILPDAVPPNLLFFVPVFLVSLALSRWLLIADRRGPGQALSTRGALLAGLGLGILYAAVGWYFTASVGQHSGDEGHYIVMTESLARDGDLDLRNNIGAPAERKPDLMHISKFSRGGHLYSWHPIGLSLLLAPFFPLGIGARHLILGLLSGLCIAAVAELCRLFGVRRRWSLVVIFLFSLSAYWGVYSSRCLPEVGGAAFAAWGVVALLRQRERPWASGWLCVACCAYLPWLHERFLPIGGAIFAAYLLAGFLRREDLRRTAMRLGVLSLVYATALAGYVALRFSMFTGGLPVRAGDFLFSYPPGIWHTVASNRGLLAVLPLFAAMLGAALWVALRDPAHRWGAITALALGAIALPTSSSHPSWDGGASLPGRFLIVVAPLFLPSLALVLERAGPVLRWWSVFLGLIPCFLFLLMLARLSRFRTIIDPRGVASIEYDHLNGLVESFAKSGDSWLHPFALVLLAGTGLLIFLERRWGRAAAALPAVVVLAAVAAADPSHHPRLRLASASVNARRLAELGSDLGSARVQAWGDRSPLGLFAVSNLFARSKVPELVSQATAPGESNDWAGRGYRWVPLVAPFNAGAGLRACGLNGRGTSPAHWAVREGDRTILEERLERRPDGTLGATTRFRCDGSGPVSILVRFEEQQGELRAPALSWTPFSPALLEAGGLSF